MRWRYTTVLVISGELACHHATTTIPTINQPGHIPAASDAAWTFFTGRTKFPPVLQTVSPELMFIYIG
jgi:hypothetical protein